MADANQLKNTLDQDKDLPVWNCEISPINKKPDTVGVIKTLDCTGVDFIPTGEKYSFKVSEEQENTLRLLSVKKDEDSQKVFAVTSYKPMQGELQIKLEQDGVEVFQSTVKNINVASVLKQTNEAKPYPPIMGYYVLPGTYEMIFLALLLLSLFGIFILKLFTQVKKRREYREIVSQSRYADPFMDFNVELREVSKQKVVTSHTVDSVNKSLKKLFFRVFNENVSLDQYTILEKRLKGMGLESHELRAFSVFKEEYNKFNSKFNFKLSEQKPSLHELEAFIEQAQKTINKLRRYDERGS